MLYDFESMLYEFDSMLCEFKAMFIDFKSMLCEFKTMFIEFEPMFNADESLFFTIALFLSSIFVVKERGILRGWFAFFSIKNSMPNYRKSYFFKVANTIEIGFNRTVSVLENLGL